MTAGRELQSGASDAAGSTFRGEHLSQARKGSVEPTTGSEGAAQGAGGAAHKFGAIPGGASRRELLLSARIFVAKPRRSRAGPAELCQTGSGPTSPQNVRRKHTVSSKSEP